MPAGDLQDSYKAVERLIMTVVKGSDDPDAQDAWHADVVAQPDTITRAMNATTDEIRGLYATYPSELPSLSGADVTRRWDVAIVGALIAAVGLAFLTGWFW
jgi:hypothetical protein